MSADARAGYILAILVFGRANLLAGTDLTGGATRCTEYARPRVGRTGRTGLLRGASASDDDAASGHLLAECRAGSRASGAIGGAIFTGLGSTDRTTADGPIEDRILHVKTGRRRLRMRHRRGQPYVLRKRRRHDGRRKLARPVRKIDRRITRHAIRDIPIGEASCTRGHDDRHIGQRLPLIGHFPHGGRRLSRRYATRRRKPSNRRQRQRRQKFRLLQRLPRSTIGQIHRHIIARIKNP